MVRFQFVAAIGTLAAHVFFCGAAIAKSPEPRPNILIFYTDDMGFADLSRTGGKLVDTKFMDSIARNGASFTNSYVTACVCSPSRAALMTGRYQQRFGFDANAEGKNRNDRAARALDISQKTFANYFHDAGYATGIFGKWHLGLEEGYWPTQRGFDEFYGFMLSGISAGPNKVAQMFRGRGEVERPVDHMQAFGREGAAFIERHQSKPWMLYLPFNAVHGPCVAPQEYLDRYANLSKQDMNYYGMLACCDDVVGEVLAKLRELKLEENTLIFIANDNGRDGPRNNPHNAPYSYGKWTLYEGGIRSAIGIQWKGHIPAGKVFSQPIAQIDFLPTALEAAGIPLDASHPIDGVSLLPLLTCKTDQAPHAALFWRFGIQYAVRKGDWKLVKPSIDDHPMLFNLVNDPAERKDLSAAEPDRMQSLQKLWDAWNAENETPRWIDRRWEGWEQRIAKKADAKASGKKGDMRAEKRAAKKALPEADD